MNGLSCSCFVACTYMMFGHNLARMCSLWFGTSTVESKVGWCYHGEGLLCCLYLSVYSVLCVYMI
jgi:hypothetical protein